MRQFTHLTLSLPIQSKFQASAWVRRTTAVYTPLKRLYSLHWTPSSCLPSAMHSAATTSSHVTVSSRSLTSSDLFGTSSSWPPGRAPSLKLRPPFPSWGPGGSHPSWFSRWRGPPLLRFGAGLHFGLHGFQDLGVGLTFLRRNPDSVNWPGDWRAPRPFPLVLRFLRRGHRNLSFLILFFFPTCCQSPSFCGVWPPVAAASVGDVLPFPFLGIRSSGAECFPLFVSFFGLSPRGAERVLGKIPIYFESGWDSSLFSISILLLRRHLWVLSIPLNTSEASFILSFTWPGLFLSIPW